MLIGENKKDNSAVQCHIKDLASLSEEEFIKKINIKNIISNGDEEILRVFNCLALTDDEKVEELLGSQGLQSERISELVETFQTWRESEQAFRAIATGHREKLLDLQWKLLVRAASSLKDDSGMYVQVQLVVEAHQQIKTRHIEMGVPQFYDFILKLTKANASLQEIAKS